jgi:hypothetical protein
MRSTLIALLAVAAAALAQIAPASARDGVPAQALLAQASTLAPLPAAIGSQVDGRVDQALVANRGGSAPVLAGAVGSAFDGVLKANATTIADNTPLVVSMAREATREVVATPGLDAPRHVQIAAAIAASAAKAAPTAAASILVAVLQALPADEQNRQDAIIIADAIDAAVPDAQLTAALGIYGNAPPPIETLLAKIFGGPNAPIVQLVTTATGQVNVSPH